MQMYDIAEAGIVAFGAAIGMGLSSSIGVQLEAETTTWT